MASPASTPTKPAAPPPPPLLALQPVVTGFVDTGAGVTEYYIKTTVGGSRRFTARHRFAAFSELHKHIYYNLGMQVVFPVSKAFRITAAVKKNRIVESPTQCTHR